MRPTISPIFAALAAATLGLGACAPIVAEHGYVPDEALPKDVQPQVDTRSTVLARLGSPSFKGLFTDEENVWIYLKSRHQSFAYSRPDVTEREVVAIRFDGAGVVTSVDVLGLYDGRAFAYDPNRTPTLGRELGILEQLFGTIGANPLGDPEDQQGPGQRRR
jgi:outer membrane protein assembly factor BamE (lipoprotein component of BamABCDE complex)